MINFFLKPTSWEQVVKMLAYGTLFIDSRLEKSLLPPKKIERWAVPTYAIEPGKKNSEFGINL